MGKNLYIGSFESDSGKAAVFFGLLGLLKQKYGKIAVFRPLISRRDAGGKDKALELAIKHFAVGQAYDSAFACTLPQARELENEFKHELLLETVIKKYKDLEKNYNFVLCLGTDYAGSGAAFEFGLNAEIAANLGCPTLLVVKSQDKSPVELLESTRLALDQLEKGCADALGCFFNRAGLTGEETEVIRRDLTRRANIIHGPNPGLYALPRAGNDCAEEEFLLRLTAGEQSMESVCALFRTEVDGQDLLRRIDEFKGVRIAPKMFEYELLEKARAKKMRIVLPEGQDERILKAADDLLRRGVADLAILGDLKRIREDAARLKLDLSKAQLIEPTAAANFKEYAATYAELRKHKGVTLEQAEEILSDPTYYGTMMVYKGEMDGMVSGAVNTTAHTIRPAFEFIKTRVKGGTVSSCFLMCLKDRMLVFADCAVLPNPTPKELADIAIASAGTAEIFGVEPRVAMLSYSTGSSGKGPDVDLVIEATRLAKEAAPGLALEGPLQYDAAIDPGVAATKLPGNPVAGRATVFIFPNLSTGNNTYKAVQRAANALAIGPVLQGLNKPVNDLSRGCTVPDIINTVAITAIQAQGK
ncbi:MAG: phosphate acetyltransferase [Deltaproteobacteria bacterium]|jgi:phosphate acetyltransferase|nr:phosphate acetyltransferase [Deltaproteobacteria bacterium]